MLYVGVEEVKTKAVLTDSTRVRKLTIPRDSFFSVGGYIFTMQYPIDIRVMAHGGLQVIYDTDLISPLQTLESNLVKWRTILLDNVEYLEIAIPVSQFEIKSNYAKVSASTGFNQTFPFNDQYYYARVYQSDISGNWHEIKTTHTDQVYNPNELTAVLTVYQGALNVKIPVIYITESLLENELRIDIYSTKGPLDILLTDIDAGSIYATWLDLSGETSKFTAPLTTFSAISLVSNDAVTGGKNALTFAELKQRNINNSVGTPNVPITNNQLVTRIEDRGYRLVKNIDNITNRMFLATRALPPPKDGSTAAGAGTAVILLQSTIEDIISQADVHQNGDRITILPTTLYNRSQGILNIVPFSQRSTMSTLEDSALVSNINNNSYFYTPFHYVLDMLGDKFQVRAYHLDSPAVEAKTFIHENDSTILEVSSWHHDFERIPTGYRLTILTKSGDAFKELADEQVVPQLSYIPPGEITRAVLNGEFLGVDDETGERFYIFDIETNYDVDDKDHLVLTSFKMIDAVNLRILPTALTTTFDLSWVICDYAVTGMTTSSNDSLTARYLLPAGITSSVAVTREQFTIRMGDSLDNLWNRARTVDAAEKYQRHTSTVYETYPSDIFETDINGDPVLTLDTNGDPQLNLLYAAGTQILDQQNQPIVKFAINSIKRDATGNPLLLEPRKLLREFDLTLVDGRYYWATAASTVAYREAIAGTLVSWLNNDIVPLSKILIERPNLFFQPQATLGPIKIIGGQSQDLIIDAEQEFTITLFVTAQAYENGSVRNAMEHSTITTVSELISTTTVDVTTITATLKTMLGNDVVGIELVGLGGELALNTLTLKDPSQKLVIKKRLVIDPTNELLMENAINIVFAKHIA